MMAGAESVCLDVFVCVFMCVSMVGNQFLHDCGGGLRVSERTLPVKSL